MITLPENLEHPHRAAIFRSTEAGWSVLFGELHEGKVRILDTKVFQAPSDPARAGENNLADHEGPTGEIDLWLEANGNPQVLVLLPAAQTISRVLHLNDAETEEQVDQELRLSAESHLLGGAPAHRVGMAAIHAREGQPRQGVLVSWPATSTVVPPSPREGIYYVPDTAALLGMLPMQPCSDALIHAEHSSNSVAIVLDSSSGLLVRSTREPMEGTRDWKDSILRTVMETAVAGHESTEQIQRLRAELDTRLDSEIRGSEGEEVLLIPESARRHLERITTGAGDEHWWKSWGLSVGALLANAGNLRPLTRLQLTRKAEILGPVATVARTFSSMQVMVMVLVAAFIAATFIPIFSAWIRLSVVQGKVDDRQALEATLADFEQQQGIYREMAGRAWPMTKLLGDLANCIPLGIQADTIMINEGDSVVLRGRAGRFQGISPVELISEAMERMESTQIFGDINYTSDPVDNSGLIQFSITATVREPYKYVRNFVQDFAKTPHVEIRYPHAFEDEEKEETEEVDQLESVEEVPATELASAKAEADPARADVAASAPARSARETGSGFAGEPARSPERARTPGTATAGAPARAAGRSSGLGAGGQGGNTPARRSEQTAARSSTGLAPIPDSLTDNEIAAMSRAELLEATSRNAKARQRNDLDEETSERLRIDFKRLLEATRNASG